MFSKISSKKREISGIVFFDLDDTLVNTTKFVLDIRKFLYAELLNGGLIGNDSLDVFLEKISSIYLKFGANYGRHFYQLSKLYATNEKFCLKFEDFAVKRYFSFRKRNYKNYLVGSCITIFKSLKEHNFILGLISAGDEKKQRDKLKYLGIHKYFENDLIFIDDKKTYEHFQRAYKVCISKYYFEDKKRIFMVGDKEKNDIIPAKSHMLTVRIKGEGKYNLDYDSSRADFKLVDLSSLDILLIRYKFGHHDSKVLGRFEE